MSTTRTTTHSSSHLYRATALTVGPAALMAALLYHPFILDLRDTGAVAAALAADETRWWVAHVAAGVAAGLVVLSFLALTGFLRERGDRWSGRSLPFIVVASVLFAFLPAMEVAMVAVARTGGDVEAVLTALGPWFLPTQLVSGALFTIGAVGFAVAVATTPLDLSPAVTWLVVAALVVSGVARLAPFGVALYVLGAALVVAMWPLAVAVGAPAPSGQNTRQPLAGRLHLRHG